MKEVQTISLGEIMAKKSGSVDPSKFPDEVFDLYSIPAFDSRQPEVVAGKLIGSTKQIVEPADVLLSKIVPHIRRSWVVGENQGRRIIASGEWIVFRSEKIYPNYLRHVLVSDPFHSKFMSTVSGVGGSLLRARPAFVEKIKIPFPPLPEQERIADILDRAESLRAKRRAALDYLDEFVKSVFIEIFGDPIKNPKNFNIIKLSEVGEVSGGLTLNSQRSDKKENLFPYLRVANVFRNKLDLSEIKYIHISDSETNKYMLKKDDILIVEGHGNIDEVGRAAVWKGEIANCAHQNHIIKVRLNENYVRPYFVSYFLNMYGNKGYFYYKSRTTSGLNTISTNKVRDAKIFLPSLDLQLMFEKIVLEAEKTQQSHQQSLLEINNLLDSLAHEAFTGKLHSHQIFEQKMESEVKI